MESFSGDTEESAEDVPGRKKSKIKSLRTRIFGRNKQMDGEENSKLSQSASDITAGKGLGSHEDLVCSQGVMGSRALSHDSIFLADEVLTDTEPARVLSQENVHSKIKALQMKLQQQKMHLGPPPLVLPIRRPADIGSRSEDESLAHSPPEVSEGHVTSQGSFSKTPPKPSSRPLPKPALTKCVPQTLPHPLPLTAPSISSIIEPPMDFSYPPQFTPCLDTSAARHRMAVKPRNQRVITKRRLPATDRRSHSDTLNNIDHPESEQSDAEEVATLEMEGDKAGVPITAQRLPSKSPEVELVTSQAEPKPSSLTFSQRDQAPPGRASSVSLQVLRVKPQRPADGRSSERPHSSFIESEFKDKTGGDFEIKQMAHEKKNLLKKAGKTEDSLHQPSVTFWPSSVHQQVQGELESTRGIMRPASGSGSFHFSITTAKNRDGERPRSSSFVGMLSQAEARHRTIAGTEDKPFLSLREKGDLRDFQLRGGPVAVGRLKQERDPPKNSVLPLDRKENLKKTESSKSATTDMCAEAVEEVESSQEEVEEAVEAQEVQEEDGKTAFGIKLRSTSQLTKFRSDTAPTCLSKSPVCEDQFDKQKRQEVSDNVGYTFKKLPTTVSCTPSSSGDNRVTEPTASGFSLPVRNNLPPKSDPHVMPAETTSSDLRQVAAGVTVPPEPQPAPQTASSEVSWMSLAMEKTRSLQQLFTSRFPRDFTGAQAATQPQGQIQLTNQTEIKNNVQTRTQTVKMQQCTTSVQAANQPSSDTVKAAAVQSRSQTQTLMPSSMSVQQKTSAASTGLPNIAREAQTPAQTNESQSNTTLPASQCLSHSPVKTNPWTTQSPLRSSTKPSSQFAQRSDAQCLAQSPSGQPSIPEQPSWVSSRGLLPTNQPKPTSSLSATTSSAAAPPPAFALGRGEREDNAQEKDGPSLSERRAVWAGSVSEKAAFLQKRAEWTTPPGTKGVEVKTIQSTEAQTGESSTSAKTTPLSKDTKPEGGQVVTFTESSPTKVPDRPRDDKWMRKNVASSSPSSSPTHPSVLQSMSDGGQPSWMELAKRKSMAWSDKTMD